MFITLPIILVFSCSVVEKCEKSDNCPVGREFPLFVVVSSWRPLTFRGIGGTGYGSTVLLSRLRMEPGKPVFYLVLSAVNLPDLTAAAGMVAPGFVAGGVGVGRFWSLKSRPAAVRFRNSQRIVSAPGRFPNLGNSDSRAVSALGRIRRYGAGFSRLCQA